MSLLDDTYAGYVNLAHRTDRRGRMEATLKAVGISAARHEGGQTPEQHDLNPLRFDRMRKRTPGTVGCWCGQLSVMRRAWDAGWHALVMEDDLVFCEDFHARMAIVEEFLKGKPWDVFWFGATFHVNPAVWHKDTLGRDVELTDHPRIVRTYGIWSTYCYLVNRTSIQKVLAMLNEYSPEADGIDDCFIRFLEPQLQTFAFVPGMVKQYDDYGDVGGGWTAFSNFSSLGPYWWADKMDEFDPAVFDWAEARK